MKIEFFGDFAVTVDLAWNLPRGVDASAQILLDERVNYEMRRWRRGGPKPTAAALIAWAESHGVKFRTLNPWRDLLVGL